MKSCYIVLALFLLIGPNGFCQTKKKVADTLKTNFKRIYILQFSDRPPTITRNAFVDASLVEDAEALPEASVKDLCQLLKIDNVLALKLKPGTKLITLCDFFNLYKITNKDRELPVKVDDELIIDPETLLISENQIDQVKIIKNRYIHIIEKGYLKVKRELEENKKRGIKMVI